MYHSIDFYYNDSLEGPKKNTWDTWHLIPSSRPVVARPTVNYKYVDIPGMDGQLDLTDYLIGKPTYSESTGSFEFIVDHETEAKSRNPRTWSELKTELSKTFNGRKMYMILADDDPDYAYEGRFFFSRWTTGQNYSTVTIDYRVLPYKYDKTNPERREWA